MYHDLSIVILRLVNANPGEITRWLHMVGANGPNTSNDHDASKAKCQTGGHKSYIHILLMCGPFNDSITLFLGALFHIWKFRWGWPPPDRYSGCSAGCTVTTYVEGGPDHKALEVIRNTRSILNCFNKLDSVCLNGRACQGKPSRR